MFGLIHPYLSYGIGVWGVAVALKVKFHESFDYKKVLRGLLKFNFQIFM